MTTNKTESNLICYCFFNAISSNKCSLFNQHLKYAWAPKLLLGQFCWNNVAGDGVVANGAAPEDVFYSESPQDEASRTTTTFTNTSSFVHQGGRSNAEQHFGDDAADAIVVKTSRDQLIHEHVWESEEYRTYHVDCYMCRASGIWKQKVDIDETSLVEVKDGSYDNHHYSHDDDDVNNFMTLLLCCSQQGDLLLLLFDDGNLLHEAKVFGTLIFVWEHVFFRQKITLMEIFHLPNNCLKFDRRTHFHQQMGDFYLLVKS